ncbi:uncharacterized protein KGF55_001491 [Candida pseudojiufengensis]|uniref:uncharacterized protein n=1 Tax=Candida pseudojiufengensis TaxID=497109 RepID=UPI00222550ED|nr:uncharacterized protein KGF55_001491 [Candida pseudojiufengensis]KAI5965271.1 hypothetical protein KGF55_001491 [Candida pseudojiufengensis]
MISRSALRSLKCSTRPIHKFNPQSNIIAVRTYADHGKTMIQSFPDPSKWEDFPNPQLAQDKDPYKKYDDPQNRRNLNDPVHTEEDMYDIWSPDHYDFISDSRALKQNLIFFGSIFGIAFTILYFHLNPDQQATKDVIAAEGSDPVRAKPTFNWDGDDSFSRTMKWFTSIGKPRIHPSVDEKAKENGVLPST